MNSLKSEKYRKNETEQEETQKGKGTVLKNNGMGLSPSFG
jgi:hypothetical protein